MFMIGVSKLAPIRFLRLSRRNAIVPGTEDDYSDRETQLSYR